MAYLTFSDHKHRETERVVKGVKSYLSLFPRNRNTHGKEV